MARKHELEIEITATGEVRVHVKGAKGRQCLRYVEVLKGVGHVKNQELTSEYYEPEPKVSIADETQTRIKGE
jgi:hypothetical protein